MKLAETCMTGTAADAGFSLIARSTSCPDASGRLMSRMTRSGTSAASSRKASAAVPDSCTCIPAPRSSRLTVYRFPSVSSTTSTRAGRGGPASGGSTAGCTRSADMRLLRAAGARAEALGRRQRRHDDRERGADARRALQVDARAEEGGELLRERQPEPRAAHAALDGPVHLREVVEDVRL